MRLASHHILGTREHELSAAFGRNRYPEYTPTCAWPEDCTVQWGHGIIPAVPFFEAFPKGTFIRGEGADIAEAEQKAFEQYQRALACDHKWGRQRPGGELYTNGAGWCRKCGGFRGRMFKPIIILGHMRKPLSRWERDWLLELETRDDPEFEAHMERVDPGHSVAVAREKRRLRLRMNLFGAA